METSSRLLAEWNYTKNQWNEFVDIEKSNKKEDNIYFAIGILILCTIGLMLLRNTSFITAFLFSVPFAILIPVLRMKFSYQHLKKNVANPTVKIYDDYLLINDKKVELSSDKKRVRSIKIIPQKNNSNFLEFDVQWITRKGPTNDEFRILIPKEKEQEAQQLLHQF